MPTEKIKEFEPLCKDGDHNPPKFQVFEEGVYRHTCSACGHQITFRIEKPTLYQ